MKTEPVTILRSLKGLTAVMLRDEEGFAMESLPLAPGKIPQQKQLLSAWHRLSEADLNDPDIFYDLLYILEHTSPEKSVPLPLKSLEALTHTPPPLKPTAANPRGFKGTKRQPPKTAVSPKVDLRPYLLNLQGTRQLIGLRKELKKKYPENKDPFLVGKFDCSDNANYFAFPFGFRTVFLPQLKNEVWSRVNDFLKLYFELGLDENKKLKTLCLKCLSLLGTQKTYQLLVQLTAVENEQRFKALEMIHRRLYFQPNLTLPENLIELAQSYTDCAEILEVLSFIIAGLSNDSSLELIIFGLDLYREFGESLQYSKKHNLAPYPLFEFSGSTKTLPVAQIRKFLQEMEGKETAFNEWDEKVYWLFGLKIAKACAESVEFKKLFCKINWNSYHPSVAHDYCTRLADNHALCKVHNYIDDYLIRHGNDRKSHSILTELAYIGHEKNEEKYLENFIPWFLKIVEVDGVIDGYTSNLFFLLHKSASEEKQLSIISLSDSSIKDFAEACTGPNDVRLIEIGLTDMMESIPDLAIDSLHTCCRSLMKTARALGCLNSTLRKEILHKFKKHPVFLIKTENQNDNLKALKLLTSYPSLFAISHRLRDKLINGDSIANDIIERNVKALHRDLNRIRINLLLELINSNLLPNRSTEKLNNSVKHALKLMQNNSDGKNVRAFKKFVYHFLDGETDYLSNHPRTQEWLSKQKNINLTPWTNGFQKRYHVGKNKTPYKLKIELDPFEELKHGTHVGSCTGLGGYFSDSAMGTVLDANKKVVYALSEKNEVVARQLLAISKDGRMVCFPVYPGGAKGFMKKLFNQFNVELAAEMKIEIMPDRVDYDIEQIISSYWHDDGNYFGQGKKRV